MNKEAHDVWEERIINKYGSLEAYKAVRQSKNIGFQKGNVPTNKIQDEFTDLPVNRYKKYRLRKAKNEKQG